MKTGFSSVNKLQPLLKYAVLLSVVAVAAYYDSKILFSSPVAVGFDGYYYVLQVNGLINGKLFFDNHTPFILYFLAGLRFLVGDTIIAIKVGTLFLHILSCVGIAGLLIKSTNNWWLGIMGSCYAATAGLHYFMISEFISNLGALTFIILGLFCIVSVTENNKKLWYSLSTLSFLIAIGCHRSAIFLLGSVAVAFCWAYFFHKAASTKNIKLLIVLLLSAIVLYFSPYLCLTQPFFEVSATLQKEFSVNPKLPITRFTWFDALNLLLAAPTILIIVFFNDKFRQNSSNILFSAIAFLSIILNLNAFIDPNLILIGIAGRLQILAYLQVALLVPYVIWLVKNIRQEYAWYVFAASLPLLIMSTQADLPYGLQSFYLADRERLINALPSISRDIPADSLIVAPHGDQFVITATTGMAAQNLWPKETKYETVYWMLRRIPRSYIRPQVKELFVDTAGSASVLIKENDFWQFWNGIEPETQRAIMFNNPQLEAFITGTSRY